MINAIVYQTTIASVLVRGLLLSLCFGLLPRIEVYAQSQPGLLSETPDISKDFRDYTNTYFFADRLVDFNPLTGEGHIQWKRNQAYPVHAFDNTMLGYRPVSGNEFPAVEYAQDPVLPFSIEFVSPRSIRIRAATSTEPVKTEPSLMLVKEPEADRSWKYSKIEGGHMYAGAYGTVTIHENPWNVELRDLEGKLLTKTRHREDGKTSFTHVLPFSFVRRASDYSRSVAAVFSMSPDEKIVGCGESFTQLNKYGQKVVLWADDVNGTLTSEMYKPIPFFMSSRGYGMFMHTSSPITCDFGATFGGANSLLIGDQDLDLFLFLGHPKEILDAYTTLTGKAPMPPLWSFGLWMSRITYFSEEEGRNVAALLRKNRIPSDVIHFDTGWFETDWRCDYQFSSGRFKDPVGMMADLRKQGFRTSLWQLPYFVPQNALFSEIVTKGLAVKNAKGTLPYEDAVLDFSNDSTQQWYRRKIAGLLEQGVSVIKVDFGEAAPLKGIYASGRTGFYEHNLYPLRYNKIVADLTREITGEHIIWARSGWAGSQRYPLHWGGDAESTDLGMAAQLRGGLSLGMSGFTFWSHDMGGFTSRTPEELYRRWLPFGVLTSHTRAHGQAPKEPWEFGEDFQNYFRKAVELRYRLMPYVYTQAKLSAEKGLPMVRALLVEFPDDPGAWQIDNQYMFGSDILVAPFFETGLRKRNVYLPKGQWIDYQTGKTYSAGWNEITAGDLQIIMLVREGAIIPHVKLAQSTDAIDWKTIELVTYGNQPERSMAQIYLPSDQQWHTVSIERKGERMAIKRNSPADDIRWTVR